MMSKADIEKINGVLDSMIQYELALSDFYKRCADVWEKERDFWLNLSQAEVQHSDNIKKIKKIITEKQGMFEVGRPFNIVAFNTGMVWVKDNTNRLISGTFTDLKILYIARDIEQSILESNYAEIVKTADDEYQTLMKDIISQTHEHKKIIQGKIEKMTKNTQPR